MSKRKRIEIQLFGDVSLNGLYCDPQYLNDLRKSIFNLDYHLDQGDVRMINWEAPITKVFEFNELKNPAIATTISSASLFCDSFPFDIACLGNNHIGDCLDEGYNTTKSFFKDRDILTVGAGRNKEEAEVMVIVEANGLNIGVLSFIGDETNPRIHPTSKISLNFLNDENKMVSIIEKNAPLVDILLINLHWGIEFVQYPKEKQKIIAKSCIDAGANVIVGHHSHCLQGVESYNEGLIIYSLGNFVFSGLRGKETIGWPSFCNRAGMYKVSFNGSEIESYEFVPFRISNKGIHLNDDDEKNIKLQKKLSHNLSYPSSKYGRIYKWNVFLNWGFRLPMFLIKAKGGIFKAVSQYASLKYIRLVLSYFQRK